jgi:putative endonuclease
MARSTSASLTNDIRTRLEQHRSGRGSEFVKQYGVYRLVHVEEFSSPQDAIAREKQLKNWRRDWKIQLIEEDNLDWSDLSHLL